MNASAPAKVNLCLFLGPARADGRHELVTVLQSVSLADELKLTVLDAGPDEVICPGVEGPNLVSAALDALRSAGWVGPPVRIEVDKRIPVAAGMGGGSADAAAVLRLADELEPVPDELISRIAAGLGADVPSQLRPGLWLGTGAGELVEALEPLAPHALVIVPSRFQLSTADVYREADRLGLPREDVDLQTRQAELRAALRAGGRLPASLLVNDLEPATRSLCPAVDEALTALRDARAEQAFVCGSGPTCAGVWWGDPEAAAGAARALAGRFPGAVKVHPV
ncbi:MAG: 4-(cytidine 5'-diphospho)-2-C-methyl-D-erythritol kinase [Solirubrobacteraceae bacterium]